MFCGRFKLPSIVEIVIYHHNHECELCIIKVEHWNQYMNTIGDDEIFLTLDFMGNVVNGTSAKKMTSMFLNLLNITNPQV